MPKAVDKTPKLAYPAGCKELNEDLNKDELLKRLKILARAFQDMGQDENNKYNQLALYLATEFFLDHPNKDVRLLVACCIADVFRIFAPEAPYTDALQLKGIFLFLTQQLRGLEDPESPSFKRYFYLLENLAWVKSFNICIELEENQEIFCALYKLMFSIISEKHSNKVANFMLDMMCPLITEADSVSQELLDIILINILEPHKSQNRHAYNLAKDLIRRTANAIEPYIQTFFNNALMLGKVSESDLSGRLFDLIYELNMISPSVLLAVLPQLEFKLKSNSASERRSVTRLLSKMFSDPDSDLAAQNKPLWICFIGRFNDIDLTVRQTCVQSCQNLIVNHPDLTKDITDPLRQRCHDPDETVRMDVVQAIVGAAKKDFNVVTDELLECVKDRTLDKKFKIRKEALMGLGHIYKRCTQREDVDKSDVERVAWIRNKVLHAYYQSSTDDRVLVERILNTSLVPYGLEPDEKMKRLFYLYGHLDPHAVKALHEVFKTQLGLRSVLQNMLNLYQKDPKDEPTQAMKPRLVAISRYLPNPSKALEYMEKFYRIMHDDSRVRISLNKLVNPDCSCKKAEECVKEILKKMGNNIPQNYLYGNVKMLLERVAPVLIDSLAIRSLMKCIDDVINGISELCDDVPNGPETGMKLLLMLSHVFPGAFQSEEVFTQLIAFIKHEDDTVSDITMEIFTNVGQRLDQTFPNIYSSLLPVLQKMVKIGTPRQAKHAIRCINALCKNKEKIYSKIFEHLKKNMDLDSPYFLSSLVAIGHMAQICPGEFAPPVRGMVSKFIVKELLMQDRSKAAKSNESWYADHLVSKETQAKIQALKMMVRWLLGLKSNATNSGTSTLRLLDTMIAHEGDLMERGKINKAEMARLRLQAGCCILKLVQEPAYVDLVTLEQFQNLALLINDPCYQVRTQFAQKLHKGLISLRLPLQYMSILSMAATDPMKERRVQVKQSLVSNINRRREYLKTNATANAKVFSLLPDYVLPFAIHLLAHDPELAGNEDVDTLKNIRECLWFIMEPLITKNENYSYSFYRKLIENIKQTKDKQNPGDEKTNMKLYAVCDLALGLVMTKTANFILKDFPAEPVLPAKLFTQPDQNCTNIRNYLPKELVIATAKVKKPVVPLTPPGKLPAGTTSAAPAGSDKTHSSSSSASSSPSGSPSPTSKTAGRASINLSTGSTNKSAGQKAATATTVTVTSSSSAKTKTLSDTSSATTIKKAAGASRKDSSTSEQVATSQDAKHREQKLTSPSTNKPAKKDTSKTTGKTQSKLQAKKGQGKITDYVTRPVGRPSKSSPSKESSTSKKDSPTKTSPALSSPGRSSISSRRGSTSSSPLATRQTRSGSSSGSSPGMSTRKRSVGDAGVSFSPAKRLKGTPTKNARSAVRNLSPELGDSQESTRSSPRKKPTEKETRPGKRTRGASSSQSSSSRDTIPSPGTPSSKSSSASPSPKKRAVGRPPGSKKAYPIRGNVRRTAPMVNGTSDGEDGTPESSRTSPSISPPKKRALTRAAVAEEEDGPNVRRRNRRKR